MINYTVIYKTDNQNEYIKESFSQYKFEKFMERVTKSSGKITICSFSTSTTQQELF